MLPGVQRKPVAFYCVGMSKPPLHPSAETWLHILFGDDNGGGHLAGQGVEGKTEFPDYWTLSRIESAILNIHERALTVDSLEPTILFDGYIDGILLRVVLSVDHKGQRVLKTAHPLRGNGVFKIINGVRVSKPLLRQDRTK